MLDALQTVLIAFGVGVIVICGVAVYVVAIGEKIDDED